MNNVGQKVQEFRQLQHKLTSLEQRILKTPSIAKEDLGDKVPAPSVHMHELLKVCEAFSSKISVFNSGLSKLANSFNMDNTDKSGQIDFVQVLSRLTSAYPVNSSTYQYIDKIHEDAESVEKFVPLMCFQESDFYQNNQLKIMTDDIILILSIDYATTAKVLIKKLPKLELSGYFIVDQKRADAFKENYLKILDGLLSVNDLTIFTNNSNILNELFMVKAQQFKDSMRKLSKVLNVNNLNENNREDRLILDTLTTFNTVFNQMHDALMYCATNITSVIP